MGLPGRGLAFDKPNSAMPHTLPSSPAIGDGHIYFLQQAGHPLLGTVGMCRALPVLFGESGKADTGEGKAGPWGSIASTYRGES